MFMRIFYLFLDILLKLTLWIYYPRFKSVNRPKKRFARTIIMSNHAASFMDPLVVAAMQPPIVFFMTRSDVFKWWLKPVLWGAHMLPIYRQLDGEDTKAKNEEVFNSCANVLKYGRNLLIFAEGFTDNTFVRRLKPVKKGAIRIGFSTLEKINWKKNIYVQATGVNYSDRNKLGSDCLISNGEIICLNDYKAEYEENPNKIIHDLTQKMELSMREQITDIRNEKMCTFHENIMRITRKGMNAEDSDKSIALEDRWQYSKNLAHWFNANNVEKNEELMQLKSRLENYFKSIKKAKINETALYKTITNKQRKSFDLPQIIFLYPFVLLSYLHTFLPVKGIKTFAEKSFKRSVFWASVKMLVGFLAVSFYNLLLFALIALFTPVSFWALLAYGLSCIPIFFVLQLEWKNTLDLYLQMKKIGKTDVSKYARERTKIAEEIKRLIPVA